MTLNEEIFRLKKQISDLINKMKDLSRNTEEKLNTPFSKVGTDKLMANQDKVFDGDSGLWKTYAVYKDEPEEE